MKKMPALLTNHSGLYPEVGCDEAGRGCLAGPVHAAAVIFPKGYQNINIRDSKQLSHQEREDLATLIKHEAVEWSVASCSPREIDRWNILACSFRAMHKALRKLNIVPRHIIVDGNRFTPYGPIPHSTIVKGDDKYLSIAAASILAKVARDKYMKKISKQYPTYNWQQNKGYPTIEHREAIATFGVTEYHRRSFQLLKPELPQEFDF